ncbi:MAG: hypothetical protein J6I98_00500 [Clostridia bacterium]|nr:hypothetical protein [Clostridia bacterium]
MRSKTSRVALCGVIAALSVVVLFLTGIIPVATIALPAVAGCFLIAVVAETNARYGMAVYAVVSLLSIFLVPDREATLMYIVFFGYYPALYGLLSRIRNRALCWAAKLFVFNAAMIAEGAAAVLMLSVPLEEMMPYGWISIPVMLVLFNLVFVLYDRSMNGLIVMYIRRVYPAISKYLR